MYTIDDFKLVFSKIPFGSWTKINYIEQIYTSIDSLFIPHPITLQNNFNIVNGWIKDTYNDQWFGYELHELKTIDTQKINEILFIQDGKKDMNKIG